MYAYLLSMSMCFIYIYIYIYIHTHTYICICMYIWFILSPSFIQPPVSLPSDSCQALPCIHASVSLLSVYFVHYILHMRDHMRFVFFCLDYFSICLLNIWIAVSEVVYVPLLNFFCRISAVSVDYCIR